eukprot:scaffold322715_cov32-Tisochrysis_lutea.AAC.2
MAPLLPSTTWLEMASASPESAATAHTRKVWSHPTLASLPSTSGVRATTTCELETSAPCASPWPTKVALNVGGRVRSGEFRQTRMRPSRPALAKARPVVAPTAIGVSSQSASTPSAPRARCADRKGVERVGAHGGPMYSPGGRAHLMGLNNDAGLVGAPHTITVCMPWPQPYEVVHRTTDVRNAHSEAAA